MQSPALFFHLLELGRNENFDEIAHLPGAGVHVEVLRLADTHLRSLLKFFEGLSTADRVDFIKAIAVYEDTVGGLGSVTTLHKLLPMVDDNAGELLDWILRNTKSYFWYAHDARSLDELKSIQSRREAHRNANLSRDWAVQAEAQERAAKRATGNLYNAVRRGDLKAVQALLAQGADPNKTKLKDGPSLVSLALANNRADIAAELQPGLSNQ